MRLVILVFLIVSSNAFSKEFVILSEIAPPFVYIENGEVTGIYKEILDNAFRESEHTYVLNRVNTHSLFEAVRLKEYDAVIGVSKYASYFDEFGATTVIGNRPLHLISSINTVLPQPYKLSLSLKRVGAVFGVGFESLPEITELTRFYYAQEGVSKLFEDKVDFIVEDPLIISCTPDVIAGESPSGKILYMQPSPIKTIDAYIGFLVADKGIIDLMIKGAQTININSLIPKYSEICASHSSIELNKALQPAVGDGG